MFFFFFDSQGYSVIEKCMEIYLHNDLKTKYYCDISNLFSENLTKNAVKESVEIKSEELNELYKHKFPTSELDLRILSEIYNEKAGYGYIDSQEAFAVLFWSFKIFKKKKSFDKNKEEIMNEVMQFFHNEIQTKLLSRIDSIIFNTLSVVPYTVQSVSDYLDVLKKISSVNQNLFFRGHSKTSYKLQPSILRSESIRKSEKIIYQELLINCPQEFKGYNHHIDYLVKMQHFGLPTRLLDVTRNPLVALYFACCSNKKDLGEVFAFSASQRKIKYENSDTVAMISSLPLFSYEEQIDLLDCLYAHLKSEREFSNIIERFIHEIRTEKPSFIDRINTKDLSSCFIVLPQKDNNRIVKQDGAFIICGINSNPENIINQELRLFIKEKPVLIFINNKESILNDLDLLSINKSTLFPEIDSVSEYIRSKYSNL